MTKTETRNKLNSISIYEGDIPIDPSVHEEYISYHGKINVENYDYEKTIVEGRNKLFDKTIPWEAKKKLLFLFGEFATPECFKILHKRRFN